MEKLCASVESVELSNEESNPSSASHINQNDKCDYGDDDLWCDDEQLGDVSSEGFVMKSELDREWHRRYDQFRTIGYRDGLTAGKEAAAQEGFNVGFKESVLAGYKWGLVRGVTSAITCLPDDVQEKLVGTLVGKEKIHNLYKSVHLISTKDALNFFNEEILADESEGKGKHSERNSQVDSMPAKASGCGQLGKYFEEVKSLLDCSALKMPSTMERQ